MRLTVVGCGDAFGSGGRLQTCYHVATAETCFLIDCGATALIGLDRLGLDPNRVETVFLSHLHGDHFAGLVWWLLHGQHVAKRTAPLTITGPVTVAARFKTAAEALFPGSTGIKSRFEMRFLEYREATRLTVGAVSVTPYEVVHPSGAPPYALRLETGGKTLSFSGDTHWVEPLIEASRDADLFITECYAFDADPPYHLNWRVIERNLTRITAKRLMLTHMNSAMLANRHLVADPRVMLAEDGLTVDI
jgi:ribonuclease BN (tRNA processing enzyme)